MAARSWRSRSFAPAATRSRSTRARSCGPGQRLAYRFVARDASRARNVGWSRAGFDTLRVVHDAFDDFENPSPAWGHTTVLWSGRDPWELGRRSDSSPPGGTAWHAGNADGSQYEPHVDGALEVPSIDDVVPGTSFVFDERHDLEADPSGAAYDGARVEVQVGTGAWQPVTPSPGYTHTMDVSSAFLPGGAPCWSGDSHGWVTRTVDLTPFAPGPVHLRVRMCSDDFVGAGGVWIDRARVRYPDNAGLDVPPASLAAAAGPAWPNPTRGTLRVRMVMPRPGRVDWALFDPAGPARRDDVGGPRGRGRARTLGRRGRRRAGRALLFRGSPWTAARSTRGAWR